MNSYNQEAKTGNPSASLRAAFLWASSPCAVHYLADGYLTIGSDGRIRALSAAAPAGTAVVDLSGRLVIPGLIDLHAHIPQFGVEANEESGLLPWLERVVFPAERAFSDPETARRTTRAFLQEQLRSGVAFSVLYGSSHAAACQIAFEEAERLGLRAIIGPALMDRNAPPALLRPAEEALPECVDLCRRWHGKRGRLFFAFTPRFAVSCSFELMRSAGEAARSMDAYIQTHLSENPGEIAAVRRLFPSDPDYTSVYDRAGLLGPKTILAHCLRLSPAEWTLLRERGCAIAHCPRSNFFLRSGVFNAREASEQGVRFGLGSDVGAGPSPDLFEEMRAAVWADSARQTLLDQTDGRLAAAEAFYAATAGAAQALGLADALGTLTPGRHADLTILDPARMLNYGRSLTDYTAEGLAELLVYRGSARDVVGVYVDGRPIRADRSDL